jgi:hypothetical protein
MVEVAALMRVSMTEDVDEAVEEAVSSVDEAVSRVVVAVEVAVVSGVVVAVVSASKLLLGSREVKPLTSYLLSLISSFSLSITASILS